MRIAALEEGRSTAAAAASAAAVAASVPHLEKSSKRVVKKRTPYEFDESEAPPRKQQSSSSSSSSNGRSNKGKNGAAASAGVESEQGWAGNNIQFRMLDARSSNPQQVYRSRAGMATGKADNHYDDDDMDDDDDESDVAVEQYDPRDGRVLLRFRSITNAARRTKIPASRVEQLCETDHSYLDQHDPSSSAAKRRKITGNNGETSLLWRYCTEDRSSPCTCYHHSSPNASSQHTLFYHTLSMYLPTRGITKRSLFLFLSLALPLPYISIEEGKYPRLTLTLTHTFCSRSR